MNSPAPPASASSSSRTDHPDLSGLWRSVGRTHSWQPLRVEGELPEGLRATVVRTGPGLMERFGRRLPHSFEADGVLMGLRLRGDGIAEGAVRIVEGPGYRAEEAAGEPLFGANAPWWRRFVNGLRRRTKATGNTSLMVWQGQAYALMEGARPVPIALDDLRADAPSDLDGVLGSTFSAHPHRLESRRTTFNFGVEFGPKPRLQLYALPDEGSARRLGEVALPWNSMVHDFAVTEGYAVFVVCPVELSLGRALLAPRDINALFRWDAARGAVVLVVPLDDVDRTVHIPVPARFVFHFANAHRRGRELRVDFVQYPDFGVMNALAGDNEPHHVTPPRLQRVVVDLDRRAVSADDVLWDERCEFPVLPAGRVGQEYGALWMTTGAQNERGFTRLDVETGAVDRWNPGPGYAASEAMFIPRPDAARDDEGWLVSMVLDGWRDETYFGIFDADRPSAGPVARVWMGQALPNSFHGTVIQPARA